MNFSSQPPPTPDCPLPEATASGRRPVRCVAAVESNESIAEATWRMRICCPPVARSILPGQFVMARPSEGTDPLLARPFALYDVVGDAIDIVYLVAGNGTRALSRLGPGASLIIWGPLGNTFPIDELGPSDHLLLVAGGIGQTPFLAVTKSLLGQARYGGDVSQSAGPAQSTESAGLTEAGQARIGRITLAYGARTAKLHAGVPDFTATGIRVELATDDGTAGVRGFVTDIAADVCREANPPTRIFGCGPEPMLAALAQVAAAAQVPLWVSLEARMACGYGVCFSCVCPVWESVGETRTHGLGVGGPGGPVYPGLGPVGDTVPEWDYRRTCIEGPIFPAERIAWREMGFGPHSPIEGPAPRLPQ